MNRSHLNKSRNLKLSSQIKILFFIGIVLTVSIGFALWLLFGWWFELSANAVQGMLWGFIQTLAGILAIAISFSLLYVQISVDIYSLRASHLLVEDEAFRRLISVYIMVLILLSFISLLMSSNPIWLPLTGAIIGILLFIVSLYSLVNYIEKVVSLITPETIIRHIQDQTDWQEIIKQSEKLIFLKNGNEFSIRIPISTSQLAQFGTTQRILLDITRRMIHQSDHIAVDAAIEALTGEYKKDYGESNVFDLITFKKDPNGLEDIPEGINRAAIIAYFTGGLLEIWNTSIQARDRIAASKVIEVFTGLTKFPLFYGFTGKDNLVNPNPFEEVLLNRFIRESLNLRWQDLCYQSIEGLGKQIVESTEREISLAKKSMEKNCHNVNWLESSVFQFRKKISIEQQRKIFGYAYVDPPKPDILYYSGAIEESGFADAENNLADNHHANSIEPNRISKPDPKDYWLFDVDEILPSIEQISNLLELFQKIDQEIIETEPFDRSLESYVFNCYANLVRLAIFAYSKKDDNCLLYRSSQFLSDRFKNSENTSLKDYFLSSKESRQILEDISLNWIGGIASGAYIDEYSYKIISPFYEISELLKSNSRSTTDTVEYIYTLQLLAKESFRTGTLLGYDWAIRLMPLFITKDFQTQYHFAKAYSSIINWVFASKNERKISECIETLANYLKNNEIPKNNEAIDIIQKTLDRIDISSNVPFTSKLLIKIQQLKSDLLTYR